jgi:hypothetical protein
MLIVLNVFYLLARNAIPLALKMPARMKIDITALFAATSNSFTMKKLIDVTAQVDLYGMTKSLHVFPVLILHASDAHSKTSTSVLPAKVSQSSTTLTIVSVLSTSPCQLLKYASQSFTSPAVASTLSSARPAIVLNATLAAKVVWALTLISV